MAPSLPGEIATINQAAADPIATAILIVDPTAADQLLDPTLELSSAADDTERRRRIAIAALLDDPNLDEAIDAAVANPDSALLALDALYRAGIDWAHPALIPYASQPKLAHCAGLHLASADPDAFLDLLDRVDDETLLLQLLRAAALSGDPTYFPPLLSWHDALSRDLDPRQSCELQALLATLDPTQYARHLLQGDLSADWLGDDRPVADFLTLHGPSDWVESLAIFRTTRDRDAFELAAAFATSAALSSLFDDVDVQDLDPADAAHWIHRDPRRVAFQLAIADEEDLATILIANTLHQALLDRDILPPAITGLPFSGPGPFLHHQPEALLAPLLRENTLQSRVALLRSLTDLRRLVVTQNIPFDSLDPLLTPLRDSPDDSLRQYALSFSDDEAFSSPLDWGCRGIHHAHRQLLRSPEPALHHLAQHLFNAPLARAPLFRDVLHALFPPE